MAVKPLIQDPEAFDRALQRADLDGTTENVLRMRYGVPLDPDAPLGTKGASSASVKVQQQLDADLRAREFNTLQAAQARGLAGARMAYGPGAKLGDDGPGAAIREKLRRL
jgi:hypothetical protein